LLAKRVGSVVLLFGWLLVIPGCELGGDATIAFDPDAAGLAMVAQLDSNGDGLLAAEEMSAMPALANSFDLFDLEADREVSVADAARRFQLWASVPGGSMPLECRVQIKGKPLQGAIVRLVPEEFLGGSLPEATGTTDAQGMAEVTSVGADTETSPGVRYGFYKVEITHPSKKIPSRYNTKTELGQEVAPESRATDGVVYQL
jgi:hypothetical protein